MSNKDDIEWITVKGNHIPIKKGQSKEEAIKEFLKDKTSEKQDIPTDRSGYSLKLKKSQRVSENMKKVMAQGYYPEEQIIQTLSKATKEGKRLKELFEKNKVYKTNYRIIYEYEGAPGYWDEERKDLVSSELQYFNTKEELDKFKEKIKKDPKFKGIMSEKEVKEWHHIAGGGKNRLIDVNKLIDMGFKIDTSTANKEFKTKSEAVSNSTLVDGCIPSRGNDLINASSCSLANNYNDVKYIPQKQRLEWGNEF